MAFDYDTINLKFVDVKSNNTLFTVVLTASGYAFDTPDTPLSASNISGFTSFVMTKDYFNPIPDSFTFQIEDSRVELLYPHIKRGLQVQLSIKNIPIMIGYVFKIELFYSENGTGLRVECKDLLEYMSQAIVYPNMGGSGVANSGGITNFHFAPTDTLEYAINTLLREFKYITGKDIKFDITDIGSLMFAQGFEAGLKETGKQVRSIKNTLDRLTMPNRGESFLSYIVRLLKHTGANIKMSNNATEIVIIKPPFYDREGGTLYKLTHTKHNNGLNNIEQAQYNFNLDNQPSVVILECQMAGTDYFHQNNTKGIAINELLAYTKSGDFLPSVEDALVQLEPFSNGYNLIVFNDQLFNFAQNLPFDIGSEVISNPYYGVDINAHSVDTIKFAASKMLAEHHDRFFEAVFRVSGFSQNGNIWFPDMMVNILDKSMAKPFSANSGKSFNLWIRRVTYRLDMGGTYSELVCTLPYTHNFSLVDSPASDIVQPKKSKPQIKPPEGTDAYNQASGVVESYQQEKK